MVSGEKKSERQKKKVSGRKKSERRQKKVSGGKKMVSGEKKSERRKKNKKNKKKNRPLSLTKKGRRSRCLFKSTVVLINNDTHFTVTSVTVRKPSRTF